ncbi:MAG: hypothetical protein RLN88_05750 [Ekhidna sp.]|uniref:hypothetical protein n=1 Tax=Ekhidna sp. TaxID=2608089 RepID=UPI0032EB95EE
MRKDINFSPVKDVHVVICKDPEGWRVYLINRTKNKLDNVMVTSRGYGETETEKQETSTLRHMIPFIDPGEYALIEPIDESVFHLNNEYWVSYFIDGQVYDKKFIFVPDSIIEENLTFIEELEMKGILHD